MTELELKVKELKLKKRELDLKEKELDVKLKVSIIDLLISDKWENALEWINDNNEVIYPNYFRQLYEVIK